MTVFGDYELVERIGRGGVAEVWRARKAGSREPEVAIKLLSITADSPGSRRLTDEWRVMAKLRHPHVVEARELITTDDRWGLVMELCLGSLVDVVRERGPLPASLLCTIGRQVCEALGAAHDQGIVHRDVKPANILVAGFQTVRLTDFGIAAAFDDDQLATQTSTVWGTLPFLAPERRHGGRGSVTADIYALGVTLAWLGCGRLIGDLYVPAVLDALRVELPPALVHVLEVAGRYDAERRYPNTAEFARALAEVERELEPNDYDLTLVQTDSYDTYAPSRVDNLALAAPPSAPRWPIIVASASAVLAAASALAVILTRPDSDRPSGTQAAADRAAIRPEADPMAVPKLPVGVDQLPACADATSRFRTITRKGPRETVGVVAADLDLDRWPDAVFTNRLDESLTIYWGGPDQLLDDPQRYSIGRSNSRASAADLDGDGDLDLITNHPEQETIALHINDGRRGFGPGPLLNLASGVDRVWSIDWDSDGHLDLLLDLGAPHLCTGFARGRPTPLAFEPPTCIGPPVAAVDPRGPRAWQRPAMGELAVRHRGVANNFSNPEPVGVPGFALHFGELLVPDHGSGSGVYITALEPAGKTLLRVDAEGGTCRMSPRVDHTHWDRALADFDRNGLVDTLYFATCEGCESNHVLRLGLPN